MPQGKISRRKVLAGIGAGTLGAFTLHNRALAQAANKTISITAPEVFLPKELRSAFTAQTGIEIRMLPFTTAPEIVSKTMAGDVQSDLLSFTEDWVRPLLASGKLQPIDFDRIKNYAHVADYFKKRELTVWEGKRYGMPHFWGYDSIAYNTEHVKKVESWAQLYDGSFRGRTAIKDDAGQGMMVGALAKGGIKDPNKLSTKDITEIRNYLIEHKKNIRTIWSRFAQGVTFLTSGEAWLLHGWMSMIPAAKKAGVNVAYARPREGVIAWNHTYVIPKNTQNIDAVYTFLNWILGEEPVTLVGRTMNYPSASMLGVKNFSKEEQQILGYDAVDELVGTLYYSYPQNLAEYIEAWSAFKNA